MGPEMSRAAIALVAGCLSLVSCTNRSEPFTLYRNSPLDPNMRIHIATFDAEGPDTYNQTNCALAEKLFSAQEGVTAKFWCEKGRYRP